MIEGKNNSRPWTPGKLWRPIETPPMDGTRICATSMGCKPHVYYWRGGEFNNWCIDYADGAGWQPTHWKPFEDGIEEALFESLDALYQRDQYKCMRPEDSALHEAAEIALAKARGEGR